jgi:hypothetical protein
MISAGAKSICMYTAQARVLGFGNSHARPRSSQIGAHHDFLADTDVLIEIDLVASSHCEQDLSGLKAIFFILRLVVSHFERVIDDARFRKGNCPAGSETRSSSLNNPSKCTYLRPVHV